MRPDPQRWQLERPGNGTRLFLCVITLLVPIVTTAGAVMHAFGSGDELRLVDDSRAATAWLTVGGVAVLSCVLWWILHRAFSRHRITLEDGAIEIATTFYKRRLALADLQLDQARVVDLDERTELKPLLKTNGTGLPRFRSGWYRLRNREKALVAMVGGPRVLWLPTRAGYGLLLQPRSPQALLDALREMAERPPRR